MATTREEAVQAILAAAQDLTHGLHVHFVNAYTVSLASKDEDLHNVLVDGICFPDGRPLVWLARFREPGRRLTQTRGPEFFIDAFDEGRAHNAKHYLLGGTQETLERLEHTLKARFPGVEIVGAWSPPFRSLSAHEMRKQDDAIRRSNAQIVWVGLGTPKQDFESARLSATLPVIACSVGAAFNFASGDLKSAPRWLSLLGLEWLYRLVQEPRRLWRRYLFGNIQFLRVALGDILTHRRRRTQ